VHHLGVGQSGCGHLEVETVDAAQRFVGVQDFFYDCICGGDFARAGRFAGGGYLYPFPDCW